MYLGDGSRGHGDDIEGAERVRPVMAKLGFQPGLDVIEMGFRRFFPEVGKGVDIGRRQQVRAATEKLGKLDPGAAVVAKQGGQAGCHILMKRLQRLLVATAQYLAVFPHHFLQAGGSGQYPLVAATGVPQHARGFAKGLRLVGRGRFHEGPYANAVVAA